MRPSHRPAPSTPTHMYAARTPSSRHSNGTRRTTSTPSLGTPHQSSYRRYDSPFSRVSSVPPSRSSSVLSTPTHSRLGRTPYLTPSRSSSVFSSSSRASSVVSSRRSPSPAGSVASQLSVDQLLIPGYDDSEGPTRSSSPISDYQAEYDEEPFPSIWPDLMAA